MYISYGTAALQGKCPALTDCVAAKQSFTQMSPEMGMDYFGVYDGTFGAAYSAAHLAERLHIAFAMEINAELSVEAPRFLKPPRDLDGWWRTTVLDAFRFVDRELVTRVGSGLAVRAPAVVALVLKEYLVLASRGATCRAVIYRGEEAVQLTSERRPEQQNQKGKNVVGSSSCNLESHAATSRPISSRSYFPEEEVLMVKREPRDKFLILATGRVWEKITPAEACSFIQMRLQRSRITMPWETALDETGSPNILAKELAEHVIRRGCQGNVTVVIILFKKFWDEQQPGTSKK